MIEDLNKKAKKDMLDELQKVMKEMMLEDKGEETLPLAAEVSVMSAEPIEESDMEVESGEMEDSYEDEMEVDLSDPEMLAKFKEFLSMQKKGM